MAELYYGVPDQLPDYQSQIDSGLSQSKEALDAARQVVINRRNADTKFRTDLYQNDLGQMYDGDREAAEKMRQYIEFQYQEGLYNDDPSKFARIVANYNAQVDMFTNHYKTTHGTSDTADGTGNTYLDVQIRQQQNSSEKFWGDTGNTVVGNEFDQAQQTYNQLNAGLQGMNVDEDGNFVAIDPLTGDSIRISDMAQYQLGNGAYTPSLEKVAPPTLYDVASSSETATAVKLRMEVVKEDGTRVTAEEAAGAEFDNLMGTRNAPGSAITERQRKFRELTIRDLADQAGLGLSDEEIEAFVTGDLSAHPDRMDQFALILEKARENFVNINRFSPSGSRSRGSGEDSSIPGLSGQSRNIPVNASGLQITDPNDASAAGDPDATSVRVDGDTLDVAAFQLEEPIEESESNPNGAYSVTHIATGARGERLAEVDTQVPMVRDAETGQLRPATEDDPRSSIIQVSVPEYIDIDGDDPRAEEIRRNLANIGVTDDTWVSMGEDTQRRLQEDNERRRLEIQRQNERSSALDVSPDNRIPPESLPPDTSTTEQPEGEEGSEEQGALAGQTPSTSVERSSGNRFNDFINDPFGFLFGGSTTPSSPAEDTRPTPAIDDATSQERRDTLQAQEDLLERSAEERRNLPLDTRAEITRIQNEYRNRTGIVPFPIVETDENGRRSVVFVDRDGNRLDDITLENQIDREEIQSERLPDGEVTVDQAEELLQPWEQEVRSQGGGVAVLAKNFGNLRPNPNNPHALGSLQTGTGQYQTFASYEDGLKGLFWDINAKQSGRSRVVPEGASIFELINVYAPSADANNPQIYTRNLLNFVNEQLGTSYTPDTLANEIPTASIVEAIARQEDIRLYQKVKESGAFDVLLAQQGSGEAPTTRA